MGTSYVDLYILPRHIPAVLSMLRNADHPPECVATAYEEDYAAWIGVEEVRNGELGIEELLQASKIPYTKQVKGTPDYKAYEEHFRILPSGTGYLRAWDEGDDSILTLQAVHEASLESLAAVQELVARHRDNYEVMTWGEQYEIYYNNLFGREEV